MIKKLMLVRAAILLIIAIIGITPGCKKQEFWAEANAILRLTAERLNIDLDESVKIIITGYNSDGSYLWDGTRVDLSIENGTLDRRYIELKDGSGEVIATANMERGEMRISARSGTVTADPDPLVIKVGEVPTVSRITASINPAILPYTGGRTQIIATVYNSLLEPIPEINVIFSTNAGLLDSRGAALTTNSTGQVTDYLETDRQTTVTIYAGDKTQTVTVNLEEAPQPNKPPVAAFTFSPTNPVSNERVYFNASASYDTDGTISKYTWDFGDGSAGRGKTTSHIYEIPVPGTKTFSVTLTVWDDDGLSHSSSQNVTVIFQKE